MDVEVEAVGSVEDDAVGSRLPVLKGAGPSDLTGGVPGIGEGETTAENFRSPVRIVRK